MHSLLQEVIRIQNPLNENRLETLAEALIKESNLKVHPQAHEISGTIKLIPHTETLIQNFDTAQPKILLDKEIIMSLNCLQHQYAMQGNHKARKAVLERLLPLTENFPNDNASIFKGTVLANLTNTFISLGDAFQARDTGERALEILKAQGTVAAAHALVSIANALGELGEHATKREMLQRALSIEEKEYGPNHIGLVATLSALAAALGELGDNAAKRKMLERVLVIEIAHYGNNHIEIARTLTNLANAISALGDNISARNMLNRALIIKERHYGAEHIEVAKTLSNFAVTMKGLGDFKKAQELFQRTLTIQKDYYESGSFDMAKTQMNLATTCATLGNKPEAQRLIEDAIRIIEHLPGYGKLHPAYQDALKAKKSIENAPNLNMVNTIDLLLQSFLNDAQVEIQKGDYQAALEIYQQMDGMYKMSYRLQTPAYANLLLHMGKAYYHAGQKHEAIQTVGKGLCLSVKLNPPR